MLSGTQIILKFFVWSNYFGFLEGKNFFCSMEKGNLSKVDYFA